MPRSKDYALREIKQELLKEYGNYCWLCGRQVSTSEITAHHIIEKRLGGPTTKDNIALVCNSCHVHVINKKTYGSKSYNRLMYQIEIWKKDFTKLKQNYVETYGSHCCYCGENHSIDDIIILPVEKRSYSDRVNLQHFVSICPDCYEQHLLALKFSSKLYNKAISRMITVRDTTAEFYGLLNKNEENVFV